MTWSDLCDYLRDIYVRKNRDYGNSVHQTYLEFGEVALVVRISDKLSRLQRLTATDEQNVKDESILDTLGDAVTYLLMLEAEMYCAKTDSDSMDRVLENFESVACTRAQFNPQPPEKYRAWLMDIWNNVGASDYRADQYVELACCLLTDMLKRWNNAKG